MEFSWKANYHCLALNRAGTIRFLMSILSFFTKANAARLVKAIRQKGLRPAIALSWFHFKLALSGGGRSAVFSTSDKGPPQFGPHYLSRFWLDMAEREVFQATQAPALVMGRRKVAMIGDLNLPQCRKYRVEQLAQLWKSHGVAYEFAHEADVQRAAAILQDATHLMFYRTRAVPQMSMYLYEARRLKLPVAYDIDDPLFSIPAYATYNNMSAVAPGLKAHFVAEAPYYLDAMNLADIVTLSTPGLCDHAASLTNRPVHLRRNFADTQTWDAAERALAPQEGGKSGPFRVAFSSGSQGHEADLATILDDVSDFILAAPDRELMSLGHFDKAHLPAALADRVTHHTFSDYADYLGHLAAADCTVMPLADDLFNRCKSGVRVLDASAVAVPSVIGRIGDLPNLVVSDQTGVIVEKGGSWRSTLETLATDRKATAEMGRAAQADLRTRWSDPASDNITAPELRDWVIQ